MESMAEKAGVTPPFFHCRETPILLAIYHGGAIF
jgi:hypothetical protein